MPGAWVSAPEVGLLWTPGYWGSDNGSFTFYDGYWGQEVGFYGGIDYGFGYFGHGYEGGRWDNGSFYYNRSVNNVDATVVHNVYNESVANATAVNRVSYNGGDRGINARPTSQEEAATHETHVSPVALQVQNVRDARSNPELRASAKDGGALSNSPSNRADANARPEANVSPRTAVHPNDLPPLERPAAPNTGDAKLDQKYSRQQEKLVAKQGQERQKLQQQQDRDHQQLTQQAKNANDAKTQQLEEKHQQQTQQMVQKHAQQQQDLKNKQQPKHQPGAPQPRQ